MSERKVIKASDIENLIDEGYTSEQVAEKLGLTEEYYKEARKVFGITKRHKKSIRNEFDLIDDRASVPGTPSVMNQALATAVANTNSPTASVPNETVDQQA